MEKEEFALETKNQNGTQEKTLNVQFSVMMRTRNTMCMISLTGKKFMMLLGQRSAQITEISDTRLRVEKDKDTF